MNRRRIQSLITSVTLFIAFTLMLHGSAFGEKSRINTFTKAGDARFALAVDARILTGRMSETTENSRTWRPLARSFSDVQTVKPLYEPAAFLQKTHRQLDPTSPPCNWQPIITAWLNPSSQSRIFSLPLMLESNRNERFHLFQAIRKSLSRAELQLFLLDIQYHRAGPVGHIITGIPDCPNRLQIDITSKTTIFRLVTHANAHALPYATIQKNLLKPLLASSHATIEAETFQSRHYNGIYRVKGDFSQLMNRLDRTLRHLQWEPDAWVVWTDRLRIHRGCREDILKATEQNAVPASASLVFSRPGYRMEWTFAAVRSGTSLIVTIDYIREESLQTEPGTCPPEKLP